MNVVDSSGWLEYLSDGPNAHHFARAIEATDRLIVPVICVAEVFKRILQQRGDGAALQAAALMRQGALVDVDFSLAIAAARLGHRHGLPLADSLVYAVARAHNAMLYTQDADFRGLPRVRIPPKAR